MGNWNDNDIVRSSKRTLVDSHLGSNVPSPCEKEIISHTSEPNKAVDYDGVVHVRCYG